MKWYLSIPASESLTIGMFCVTEECDELAVLQEKVGGFIEAVPARVGVRRGTLIVNEEGLLKRLRTNPRASALRAMISAHPLVGDAVLAGPVKNGEFVGLSDATMQEVEDFLWRTRRCAHE
ncbi:MAG: DUF3846 domain-containing protein [Phycisphaerales bacterium]|nr:DUF3846 domain-containing protein [Phycisphaerales bacterium]